MLRLLAANRNPESFVAGAAVVHQSEDSPRQSDDLDFFHDSKASLDEAVTRDLATLAAAGYSCRLTSRQDSFARARIERGADITKLEWVQDSVFRFFPIEPDELLGWRLNFWDAATNKLLAFAGRTKSRDYFDTMFIHDQHLPLGALAWAAAGKDPGLTPELIIDQARRNSRYPEEDSAGLKLKQPVDWRGMKQKFLRAAEEAESLFLRLPPAEMGCFYLDSSAKPVCPDPASAEFGSLTRHFGSVKGAWPRIVEE